MSKFEGWRMPTGKAGSREEMVLALFIGLADPMARLAWLVAISVTRLLPVSWTLALAEAGGILLYYSWPPLRRDLVHEARDLLGGTMDLSEQEYLAIVKDSLRIGLMRQAEFLVRGKMPKRLLERIVIFEGLEDLNAGLASGGVLLVTAHFGAFLRGPLALGYKGYRINQLAGQPIVNSKWHVTADIQRHRERDGERIPIHFIPVKGSVRQCLQVLQEGSILVAAFDGRVSERFVEVEFLGRRRHFSPGMFRLADLSGATVLPFFLVTPRRGPSRAIIGPELKLPRNANGELDQTEAVQAFARIFEKFVAAYPAHFLMTYHRARGLGRPPSRIRRLSST